MPFVTEEFIESCRLALDDARPQPAMREVVIRAVAEPAAVIKALGEPKEAGIETLHHAPDLTILNVVWAPGMTVMPHDHQMLAVIGVYAGGEDNIFWRRAGDALEAAGAEAIRQGEAASLGHDIIHSVTNPLDRFTGAVHVYSGDFFTQERSQWDPETLLREPYDTDHTRQLFAKANDRYYGRHSNAG
ncbi:MAG: hypothetical protein RIC16_07575 [Rhodospirillales bacterium]